VDLDGLQDLVAASTESWITVFWQSSAGEFETEPTHLDTSDLVQVIAVEAVDADDDGDLDLLCTGNIDSMTVFRQLGPREFDLRPVSLDLGTTDTEYFTSLAAADLDGDGDIDLIAGDGGLGGNGCHVIWNTGGEQFSATPRSFLDAIGVFSYPMLADSGDFDGDGDLDAAVVCTQSSNTGTLAIMRQSSSGVFDATPIVAGSVPVIQSPMSVAAADVDGDADLDLVVSNYLVHTVTIFEQIGSGQFTPHADVVSSPNPYGVCVADIDGDGRVDLVTQDNGYAGRLCVFWQMESGDFDPSPTLLIGSVSGYPRNALLAADMDNDGDLDLVTGRGAIYVYWQTGARQFASEPTVVGSWPAAALCVDVADLDGDGDLDLIGGGHEGLRLYFQTGARTFSAKPDFASGEELYVLSTEIGDVDHDGDLDIVAGTYSVSQLGAGGIYIFQQTSVGVFESHWLGTGPGPFWFPGVLRMADFNGDGDLDVLALNVGNATSSAFTLFVGGD
jgi:hypothetical protein